tara:strand:+ start:55 stop:240 length:186 start_codon:yes stop_codon:yes gene_type:complete
MLTVESLFAMIDEMHAIRKQASVIQNHYLGKQVKMQKIAPVQKRAPSKEAKKRLQVPAIKP